MGSGSMEALRRFKSPKCLAAIYLFIFWYSEGASRRFRDGVLILGVLQAISGAWGEASEKLLEGFNMFSYIFLSISRIQFRSKIIICSKVNSHSNFEMFCKNQILVVDIHSSI